MQAIQLPSSGLRKALEEGPSTWVNAANIGDPDEALGLSLSQPCPLQQSGGVTQQMED